MQCKLCLQEKILLKKSHIVPDFMYQEVFDEKHALVKVQLKDYQGKSKFSGEYESNILCQDCDQMVIGQLDDYAAKLLYGGKITGIGFRNEVNQHGVAFTYCWGIDYKKFKLFLLSLLWRFSISSRDFYNFVNLGPLEEVIRKMILERNPGTQMDFPCMISTYRHHNDLPFQMVSQPISFTYEGKPAYSIIIAGLLYMFVVEEDFKSDVYSQSAINEKGELRMIHLPPDNAKKILNKYIGRDLFR